MYRESLQEEIKVPGIKVINKMQNISLTIKQAYNQLTLSINLTCPLKLRVTTQSSVSAKSKSS